MESRKLIKFGKSSHIISLPNNWLKKNKLKKGDLLYISEESNNELKINPQLKDEKQESEISIVYDGDLEEIHRKIIGNYIAGYSIINIRLEKSDNIDIIKNYIDSLMSLEIIEESNTEIKVKDLLNIKEISMEKIVRRIDTLIRSMMEDTKLSNKTNNYEEIFKRDYNINKLTFLSYRVLKKCLDYPKLAEFIGIKYNRIIEDWLLVFDLEKLGDEIKRISRYLTRLKNKNIKDLIGVYSEVCEDYNKCMNAYYKNDFRIIQEIIKKKDIIIKKCNLIVEKNNNPYVFNIMERAKTLEKYIRDIGRLMYK
jgi:phosphate uptake regulator